MRKEKMLGTLATLAMIGMVSAAIGGKTANADVVDPGYKKLVSAQKKAGITNLEENKEYSFDLDEDGNAEKVSFVVTSKTEYDATVTLNVNDKEVFKKEYDESTVFNCVGVQVLDINKKDGKKDIYIYENTFSEDITWGSLYTYKDGKLSKTWKGNGLSEIGKKQKKNYYPGSGIIMSTDGKGKFDVVVDRAVFCDRITGNHHDIITYKMKNNKVSLVSKNAVKFFLTYGSDMKGNFKTAKKLKGYTKNSKKSKRITIAKGTKCTAIMTNVTKNGKVSVQYKTKKGKKFWLFVNDFKEDEKVFKKLYFAD
ncbi:MAG: hypothetical protein K6G65_08395 [Lachnospiraceae bacterium]|nr:hypothetical protein [Lachnospiraceae bacterium]